MGDLLGVLVGGKVIPGFVGIRVGVLVGERVGALLGILLGAMLGILDGARVGAVGADDGVLLGAPRTLR